MVLFNVSTNVSVFNIHANTITHDSLEPTGNVFDVLQYGAKLGDNEDPDKIDTNLMVRLRNFSFRFFFFHLMLIEVFGFDSCRHLLGHFKLHASMRGKQGLLYQKGLSCLGLSRLWGHARTKIL